MNQAAVPLFDGLLAYQRLGLTGFHTPGHTGGRAFALADLMRLDLTELSLQPGGPCTPSLVRNAEELAAELFGAARTFFLTNGASIGILAMTLAACPPGGKIVIGRDCHLSVVNACIIGDLRPAFLAPIFTPGWPFPLGVEPAQVGKALVSGKPVLITNPTYQGVAWDLRGLAAIPGTLLVDEAHGAHLAFRPGGMGARSAGAHAWVHGSHKTLGSLTQTGMLHLGSRSPRDTTADWLARFSSSSPSYPLLASLDLARRWAAHDGGNAWDQAAARMKHLKARLSHTARHVLDAASLPRGAASDPAKLTVAAPGGGYAAASLLHREYGLQVEAAGLDWVTLLVTPFHTAEEVERLSCSLSAVIEDDVSSIEHPPWPPGLPERVLWPHAAAASRRGRVPLRGAVGLVAAEPICPYPPGIPLVWPGEKIEGDAVRFVEAVMAAGGMVTGVDDAGGIAVVVQSG